MLSLYLRRSFRRRPMRHFALFWVLMCSFLLPLVVSVYRDSLIYGSYLFTMDFSQGQAFHISGVQPEDVELLRGIDGLTEPYYEDRIIYLNFATEEAWEHYSSPSSRSEINGLIRSRLAQSGRDTSGVEIMNYTYEAVHGIEDDEYMLSMWRRMLILSLGLSLFSGLIIQSAYRNHIAAFSPELIELAALGATKGQVIRMFLAELAVLFPLAAGCAVGISYGVMRTLYRQFFEQTTNADVVWRVFYINPKNTALQIGFYLLVCLGALAVALLRKSGRKPVKAKKRAATLPRLWVQQTRPPFVQCLLILIPLVTVFVVMFNLRLRAYSYSLEAAQSVEMSVQWINGLTQADIDFIAAQPGVRHMEPIRKFSSSYAVTAPDGRFLLGNVRRYQDIAPGQPDLEKDQFAANFPEKYPMEGTYRIYSQVRYQGQISLTMVKRLTPAVDMPEAADIYISSALMDELEATAPITRVNITTTQQYASTLESALRQGLPANYVFTNTGSQDLAFAAVNEGELWLISWIFCVLSLVAMQIVWVQLSAYVRECGPMLRTIYHLGASRRQVSRLIPVWRAAIAAATVPFFIAVVYTCVRYRILVGRTGGFLVSLPLIGIYALIAAIAALSFLLPVKCTLGQILDDL